MAQLRILWHGTDRVGARNILSCGYFVEGTYFARSMEDALGFGNHDHGLMGIPNPELPGCHIVTPVKTTHVFGVAVSIEQLPPLEANWWQWVCPNDIQVDQITSLRIFDERMLLENSELKQEVFDSQEVPEGL
jgi:hypothetical protein